MLLRLLLNIINKELKKLILWLNCNRLALNISKTNFVIFCAHNKPLHKNVTILLGKQAIEQRDCVKYLGLLIDSKLQFKEHIATINKKISRTIGLMTKLRYYMNQDTFKLIYHGLIHPYLNYGITTWGNSAITTIAPLYILQKRAVRLICDQNFLINEFRKPPSAPLFKKLSILTINDLFKYELLKFVYNSLTKSNPRQFHDYYNFSSSTITTTNVRENKLILPISRTTNYGLKSLRFIGAKTWNSIPLSLRSSTSLKVFTIKIKEYLICNYSCN